MFERYTEQARRVLFFARYEACEFGGLSIESEHLLLGLIRQSKGLTSRVFAQPNLSLDSIRKKIEGRITVREKVATSVEIPFSDESKRILQFAAEESDRLLHNYIGAEHLLLGILREERSLAGTILMEKGLRLDAVRQQLVTLLNERPSLAMDVAGFWRHREQQAAPGAVQAAGRPTSSIGKCLAHLEAEALRCGGNRVALGIKPEAGPRLFGRRDAAVADRLDHARRAFRFLALLSPTLLNESCLDLGI
jgi:ATP-dependent Clp protease ATP-binding subunit ClpA